MNWKSRECPWKAISHVYIPPKFLANIFRTSKGERLCGVLRWNTCLCYTSFVHLILHEYTFHKNFQWQNIVIHTTETLFLTTTPAADKEALPPKTQDFHIGEWTTASVRLEGLVNFVPQRKVSTQWHLKLSFWQWKLWTLKNTFQNKHFGLLNWCRAHEYLRKIKWTTCVVSLRCGEDPLNLLLWVNSFGDLPCRVSLCSISTSVRRMNEHINPTLNIWYFQSQRNLKWLSHDLPFTQVYMHNNDLILNAMEGLADIYLLIEKQSLQHLCQMSMNGTTAPPPRHKCHSP